MSSRKSSSAPSSPSGKRSQSSKNQPRGAFPDGWEQAQMFHVYAASKNLDETLKNVGGKRQGVWKECYSFVPNPCEIWVFEEKDVPKTIMDNNNQVGVWGYKPGVEDKLHAKPEDVWFFPPRTKDNSKHLAGSKLPNYFIPQGKWSFPVRKRDISSIEPEKTGFLNVGSAVKNEKLDVAGTWRMLYKRDGEKEPEQPPALARIHIQKPNGDQFTLPNIDLHKDTIGDIKDKVNKKIGLPHSEQRLHFNGQRLDKDQPTLDECGILNDDILVLSPMIIHIKDNLSPKSKGAVYTLQVDPTDTIRKVKDKLERQEGIPRAQKQRLSYQNNILKDKPTLRDYGIPHEAFLVLEPMQVHINKGNKRIATLDVTPTDTVHEIKNNIKLLCGIPTDEQRLVTEPDCGKELDSDNGTLQQYGIQHNDTLYLEPMQIHVRTPLAADQKTMTFKVKPTTKISDVKRLVADHPDGDGLDPKDQRLLLPKDGHLPLDDNSKTLKDYGIVHNDVLDLEGMRIIIKDVQTGNKFPLNVEPNDTIDRIKDQIYDKENIPKDDQYLLFGGNLLDDPMNTLDDHNIKHMNVVNLDKMKVYVKDWKGKTFTQYVDPDDTIEDVKRKIQDRENIPINEQVLKFDGNLLDDPKSTVKDNNIKYLDTLNLGKKPPTPMVSPKSVVAKSAPSTPVNDPRFTVGLSPWKSLEGGYVKKKKIQREGKRAKSHEYLKNRYHADLATDVQELTLMSMEKYAALNNKRSKEEEK